MELRTEQSEGIAHEPIEQGCEQGVSKTAAGS
jgi:hypothetical protein